MTLLRAAPPMGARTSPPRLRQWDWILVLSAVSLCLLGAALIWSATSARLVAAGQWSGTSAARQVMNLVLGLALCWVVSRLGHRAIRRYTPDPVRRQPRRVGARALAAGQHHQRRPGLDPAAGRVHHPALGVRQGRDHRGRRAGARRPEPVGRPGSAHARARPGDRRGPRGADHAAARPGHGPGDPVHRGGHARDRRGAARPPAGPGGRGGSWPWSPRSPSASSTTTRSTG